MIKKPNLIFINKMVKVQSYGKFVYRWYNDAVVVLNGLQENLMKAKKALWNYACKLPEYCNSVPFFSGICMKMVSRGLGNTER